MGGVELMEPNVNPPDDVGWQVHDSVPNGQGMPKFPDFPPPDDPATA